jgi:hypothetical protein
MNDGRKGGGDGGLRLSGSTLQRYAMAYDLERVEGGGDAESKKDEPERQASLRFRRCVGEKFGVRIETRDLSHASL